MYNIMGIWPIYQKLLSVKAIATLRYVKNDGRGNERIDDYSHLFNETKWKKNDGRGNERIDD